MKKLIKFLLGLLVFVVIGFFGFLYWAIGPGIAPEKLGDSGIIFYGTTPASKPRTPLLLKIVSYNMGYASGKWNNDGHVLTKPEVENHLEQMSKTLKVLSPDLVFLQEVDFFSRRSFESSQMEYLAKALELPYAAYALTWNKRYVAWPYWPLNRHFGRLVSGQAILSRYPLSDSEILSYAKPKDNPFWYNWFYIDRLVQRVKVTTGGIPFEVYNVHLEAFSAKTRKLQLDKLSKWIPSSATPSKIIGGDFNLIWESKKITGAALNNQKRQLADFTKATGLVMGNPSQKQFTFPSWEPEKRIDFIFYSPDFESLTGGVIDNLAASDHLPVWSILRWAQNQKSLGLAPSPE